VDVALWIAAGLMAGVFLLAGTTKAFIPRARLLAAPGAGWVNDFGAPFIKMLGAFELLGAAGLILPAAVHIAPLLVPLAATGLAVIMSGAAVVELRRGEPRHAALNLTYLAILLFIIVGRVVVEPFTG
jgi:DoxX-like family